MLKIQKEGTELLVPSGSYENLYQSLGFKIVEDKSYIQTKQSASPTKSDNVMNTEGQNTDKKTIKDNKDNV